MKTIIVTSEGVENHGFVVQTTAGAVAPKDATQVAPGLWAHRALPGSNGYVLTHEQSGKQIVDNFITLSEAVKFGKLFAEVFDWTTVEADFPADLQDRLIEALNKKVDGKL
jgi:hypothetical protein